MRKIFRRGVVYFALLLVPVFPTLASAEEAVDIGGSRASLLRPKSARGSVILMPGGDGSIDVDASGQIGSLLGNQLVRTRGSYFSRGLAVLVIDSDAKLSSAVEYMAKIKRPVVVIATSRGTIRAARGIADGARPDALVLTSGLLSPESGSGENVKSILGSPANLPKTLVIHHRNDACRVSLPAGVEPFMQWAGPRARLKWMNGGANEGNPCQAAAYHGFNGLDGQIVALASSFR